MYLAYTDMTQSTCVLKTLTYNLGQTPGAGISSCRMIEMADNLKVIPFFLFNVGTNLAFETGGESTSSQETGGPKPGDVLKGFSLLVIYFRKAHFCSCNTYSV